MGCCALNTRPASLAVDLRQAMEPFTVESFLPHNRAQLLGRGDDPTAVIITGGQAYGKAIWAKTGRDWVPVRKDGSSSAWLLYRVEFPYEASGFLKVVGVDVTTFDGELYARAVVAKSKLVDRKGQSLFNLGTEANAHFASMNIGTVATSPTCAGFGVCDMTGFIPVFNEILVSSEISGDDDRKDDESVVSIDTEVPLYDCGDDAQEAPELVHALSEEEDDGDEEGCEDHHETQGKDWGWDDAEDVLPQLPLPSEQGLLLVPCLADIKTPSFGHSSCANSSGCDPLQSGLTPTFNDSTLEVSVPVWPVSRHDESAPEARWFKCCAS